MTGTELTALLRGLAPAIREAIDRAVATVQRRVDGQDERLKVLESRAVDAGRFADLLGRVAALEAQPVLRDAGVWEAGKTYGAGAIVSWDGSGWIAQRSTQARPGGVSPDSRAWRLLVKHGRDGRDAPAR